MRGQKKAAQKAAHPGELGDPSRRYLAIGVVVDLLMAQSTEYLLAFANELQERRRPKLDRAAVDALEQLRTGRTLEQSERLEAIGFIVDVLAEQPTGYILDFSDELWRRLGAAQGTDLRIVPARNPDGGAA